MANRPPSKHVLRRMKGLASFFPAPLFAGVVLDGPVDGVNVDDVLATVVTMSEVVLVVVDVEVETDVEEDFEVEKGEDVEGVVVLDQ